MAIQAPVPTAPPASALVGQQSVLALPRGKPFTVAFDGSVLTGMMALQSVRDIERLMKVLQAQKAAFEAMQDEEDDPRDPDLMHDTWAENQAEQAHELSEEAAH